jgi:hypothetical protein
MTRTKNKSDAFYVTIEIKSIGGKPMYKRKQVVLPAKVWAKLKGKGEGAEISIYKHDLVYKEKDTPKD